MVLPFQGGESLSSALPKLLTRVTRAANAPVCAVAVRLSALPPAACQPLVQSHSKPGLPTRFEPVTVRDCCAVVLRPAESMTSTATVYDPGAVYRRISEADACRADEVPSPQLNW